MSLELLSRVLVGGVLLLSAIAKLGRRAEFRRSIEVYRIVRGGWFLDLIIGAIVLAEATLAFSLLGSWLMPWSAVATVAMLGLFTLVVTGALVLGKKDIRCGCLVFGRNEPIGWHVHLRNGALTFLVLPSIVSDISAHLIIGGVVLMCASFVAIPSHSPSIPRHDVTNRA